jgi:hypothetical protein
MDERLKFLSFEDWVTFVFDHEVGGPQWYFDPKAPFWIGPAVLTVSYITRLFEDPLPFLSGYSDEQLNQGFWYLVSNGASDMMFALNDESVHLEQRIRCLKSFRLLFEHVFAAHCSPHLSHFDEAGARPLNSACYMWWDLFPLCPAPGSREVIGNTALEVMAEILALDSLACQESALHGLGHWRRAYPNEVEQIIDRFLDANKTSRPELIAYAKSARTGCVL